MSEEKNNIQDFDKDFEDFADEEDMLPEIDEDLMEEDSEDIEEVVEETTEEIIEEDLNSEENNEEAKTEEIQNDSLMTNELDSDEQMLNYEEHHANHTEDFHGEFEYDYSQIEELHASIKSQFGEEFEQDFEQDDEDAVVKKYIFYASKDFVPVLDNLTTDERSAYINDAIQIKIDLQDENRKKNKKKKALKHFIVMLLTCCFTLPIIMIAVHKSIMATFNNYKYTQDSFEKLYRQRFAKDKAYMRSIQYNRELETRKKSH